MLFASVVIAFGRMLRAITLAMAQLMTLNRKLLYSLCLRILSVQCLYRRVHLTPPFAGIFLDHIHTHCLSNLWNVLCGKVVGALSWGFCRVQVNSALKSCLVTLSTAVKRLGPFFVLFREISFTMKWNHEQGNI